MDSVGTEEINETKKLIELAKHPNLKKLLQNHLMTLERDDKDKKDINVVISEDVNTTVFHTDKLNTDATTNTIQRPVESTTHSSSSSVETVPSKRPISTSTISGKFVPIEDYAWDQGSYGSPTVSIFIDLPDVGKVKQNCDVKFSRMGFEFTVTDLNGKNYKLVQDNLDKDIVPEKSTMVVKANRVILKLQKKKGEFGDSYDNWTSLTAKKKRDPTTEESKKKDPMGGIMDMMKDMYEEGDENMKKIIGEAMLKSKQGQGKDPKMPSMPTMDDDDMKF